MSQFVAEHCYLFKIVPDRLIIFKIVEIPYRDAIRGRIRFEFKPDEMTSAQIGGARPLDNRSIQSTVHSTSILSETIPFSRILSKIIEVSCSENDSLFDLNPTEIEQKLESEGFEVVP